jgi:thioredoxin 1
MEYPMIEAQEENFKQLISDGLVLVDFATPYCPPCRQLIPVLSTLKNVRVVKVDVTTCMNIGSEYNIVSVPTIIFFKNGMQVYRTVGLQSQELLQAKIDELNA